MARVDILWQIECRLEVLVAPYRATLRYYRCDTPYRAILSRGSAIPQNGAIPKNVVILKARKFGHLGALAKCIYQENVRNMLSNLQQIFAPFL